MARDRRGRIVYNEDATVIEETPSVEVKQRTDVVVPRRSAARNVEIGVADVIDTFASYVSKLKWFERELADRPGKCLICQKDTMCKIRKICADCMNKYSSEIYDLASEAVDNGQTSITLNTVK